MFSRFFNKKKVNESMDSMDSKYEQLQKEFDAIPKPKWMCFEFETNEQVCEWLNSDKIQYKIIKRDDVVYKDGKYEVFALYDEYRLRRMCLKNDLDFFYLTM